MGLEYERQSSMALLSFLYIEIDVVEEGQRWILGDCATSAEV